VPSAFHSQTVGLVLKHSDCHKLLELSHGLSTSLVLSFDNPENMKN